MKPSEVYDKLDWCRGTAFCDAVGNPVRPTSQNLKACCILGAITLAHELSWVEGRPTKVFKIGEKIAKDRGGISVSHYNDEICKSKQEAVAFLKEFERIYYAEND